MDEKMMEEKARQLQIFLEKFDDEKLLDLVKKIEPHNDEADNIVAYTLEEIVDKLYDDKQALLDFVGYAFDCGINDSTGLIYSQPGSGELSIVKPAEMYAKIRENLYDIAYWLVVRADTYGSESMTEFLEFGICVTDSAKFYI